ncbi:allophanate hydrolase subunit 1 family protein (plasmid) [Sinorhizobium sp. RAC02]|nr:allophanate hydrolase subunit 1 family protein [Sinorhizobium sp. RAC02]
MITAHLAGQYDVFMYGFAPGYAYLAGVPETIRMPRKPAAVRGVPAGSVLIAGPQCLVSTITMPTGWWIIGRSPTRILTGKDERPFLFDVGDRVRLRRISRAEYDAELGL